MSIDAMTPSRILVVDDDPFMARTLADILQLEGYTVTVAFSGFQALKELLSENYFCVLSDIRMPGMSGLELHQAIKAKYPTLPVVLMTAYAADELIRAGLDSGVLATLTKPVDIEELLALLARLPRYRAA
jgi:CheY-like chemotaxis protein